MKHISAPFSWSASTSLPQVGRSVNGQLLSIAQNTALFSLLGTYYGGDGISNFALPNLQGRVPIHQGTGAGLSPYTIGQLGGRSKHHAHGGQSPLAQPSGKLQQHSRSECRPNRRLLG